MRLLFVLPEIEPEAHTPAGMLYQLAVELGHRGHCCDVLVTSVSIAPNPPPQNIQFIEMPLAFTTRLQKAVALTTERASRRIRRAIDGRAYDVAFVIAPAARYGDLLLRLHAQGMVRRSVVMAYDTYPQAWADLGIVRQPWVVRQLLARERRAAAASSIGGLSAGSVAFLTEYYRSTHTPIVIPFFGRPPQETVNPTFAADGPLRLLFGGRVFYGRWIEGLIDLAAQFPEEVLIDCYGGADLAQTFALLAAQRNVANIRFRSSVPGGEYERLLTHYHVGLATTGPEFRCPSYPSKAVEYMRAGLPILAVTDDFTDYPDLIEVQARCGFAGRSSDPTSAKWALERMLAARESGALSQLGLNGRSYYAKHFVIEAVADSLLSQLANLDRGLAGIR